MTQEEALKDIDPAFDQAWVDWLATLSAPMRNNILDSMAGGESFTRKAFEFSYRAAQKNFEEILARKPQEESAPESTYKCPPVNLPPWPKAEFPAGTLKPGMDLYPLRQLLEYGRLAMDSQRRAPLYPGLEPTQKPSQPPEGWLFWPDDGPNRVVWCQGPENPVRVKGFSSKPMWSRPPGKVGENSSLDNWPGLVHQYGNRIGEQFKDVAGRIWTFFGLVSASDDYYYGMVSLSGQLHLMSAVGNLDSQGMASIGKPEKKRIKMAERSGKAEAMCACKGRKASACPGEWEPGCDLGNNPKYVKVYVPSPEEEEALKKKV